MKLEGDIIGLDLGRARTGVARLNVIAQLAEPLSVIEMQNSSLVAELQKVIEEYSAAAVVAGVPRGLDGQTTEQTKWAQSVVQELRKAITTIPIFTIDEAVTTREAEQRSEKNESVDSVAAGIIVEDFIKEVARGNIENVIL